jgi:Zn-dependent peptidase ImmA (M78 family)/transcriptional regulator with XRE-family HTH domain
MNQLTVNPEMVILAREARGVTQEGLSDKVNLHKSNISRLEKGEIQKVSEYLILAISKATSFPPQFFFQEGRALPVNLSYRKRENVPVKLITPIDAQINIITRHVEFIEDGLKKPTIPLPVFLINKTTSPSLAAKKLRNEWKIKEPVISNLTKLLEQHGLIINAFDFGTERVDSRTMLTKDKHPLIFFNSNLLGDRQRFSLAYELAQLVMHTFLNVPAQRDIKKEANEFAAEFLMPKQFITKDFERGITLPILAELKQKWKVSMISLLYRADDLGFLTANQKRYLIQQFNEQKIRRREPTELDVPIEKPQLMRQLLAEYMRKSKMGVKEMSELLRINTNDYLRYYG